MRDLGQFGAALCDAAAIDNRGQIVINRSFETNADLVTIAAIYHHGPLEELPSLGGSYTIGTAINSHGHVVGISRDPSARQKDSLRALLRSGLEALPVRSMITMKS